MHTFVDYVEKYKKLGNKLGDVIPSDTQLCAEWGVHSDSDLFFKLRTILRTHYQYASNPDGTWTIVFEPRNKKSATTDVFDAISKASYVNDFTEYLRSCNITTLADFNKAKQEARAYALSNQPNLISYYDAYITWFKRNLVFVISPRNKKGKSKHKYAEAQSNAENIGHKISVATTAVCRQFKRELIRELKSIKPVVVPDSTDEANSEAVVYDMYKTWCDTFAYLPDHRMLEVITGHNAILFNKAYDKLQKQGYAFDIEYVSASHAVNLYARITPPPVWTEEDEANYQAALSAKLTAEAEFNALLEKKHKVGK